MHAPPIAAMTGFRLVSTMRMTVRNVGSAVDFGCIEFANVGAAREGFAGADDDNGVDAGVGMRTIQSGDNPGADLVAETVHRRIV
jgi:hypothetical protein